METPSFENKEKFFLEVIDLKIADAAKIMDLWDLDEDADAEEGELLWEQRHHCGVCQVRTVMEEVWPSIESYIDWLKLQIPKEES